MKRLTKQNKIVVIIVSIMLVLTVGYALFSETLNIKGTAKASGNFDLIFSEVLRNELVQKGASVNDINITNESKTLSIGDTVFNFPSSYIEVATMVENKGSIDAVLEGIKVTGLSNEFKLTLTGAKEKELFKSGEKKKVIVKIEWLETSTTTVPKTRFDIELVYNQAPDGYVPPVEQSDLFTWDGPTIVSGLTDKGIAEVKANGGKLVIPEGVTEIASPSYNMETGEGIFDKGFSPFAIGKLDPSTATYEQLLEYSIITSVSLPSTLTKIGHFAFLQSKNLTGNLILPDGLKDIGACAFNYTKINGELIIPETVEEIKEGAFAYTAITSLKLGNNVKRIGNFAFDQKGLGMTPTLTGELIIPNSVEIIEEDAFRAANITSLKLGSNVKSIGTRAFSETSISGELIIPDGVETIGEDAFSFADISSLKIGSGIKTIETDAFWQCGNLTGELYIPDNVMTIGKSAFSLESNYNNKLTSISISKNTDYVTSEEDSYSATFKSRPTPTIRD